MKQKKKPRTLRRLKHYFRYRLASLWRLFFKRTKFIAVTGSCGKTTTSDLLGELLCASPTRLLTRGNNVTHAVSRAILLSRPCRDRHLVFEVSGHAPGAITP